MKPQELALVLFRLAVAGVVIAILYWLFPLQNVSLFETVSNPACQAKSTAAALCPKIPWLFSALEIMGVYLVLKQLEHFFSMLLKIGEAS